MGELLILLVLVIVITICIGGNLSEGVDNSNLTLDVDRMYHDSVHVNIGTLSKAEYERRKRTGYYMVPKGQEYSFLDELRKKRVEQITKDWRY